MTSLSSVSAALEGFRVMRREPKAVLYWIAVWALAIAAIGLIKAVGGGPAARAEGAGALGVIRSYGPFAPLLAPMLLALWLMNTATIYRAVLRPGEHGWHLFKLGADEARIAVVSLIGTVLVVIASLLLWFFLRGPVDLLFGIVSPVSAAAPGLGLAIAALGAAATVFLEIWVGVRFSLAPVQTFAEAGFPLDAYWGFARGRFWRLLGAYLIVVLEIAGFFALFAIVGLMVEPLFVAVLAWHGPRLVQRLLIVSVLVPIAALSSGVVFVVPSTLVCACQAHAYRAIAQARTAEARAVAVAAP